MTPEGAVKDEVKQRLNRYRNVHYFMYVPAGYGTAGVHDFVCCVAGKYLSIECKADGNMPTPLQDLFAQQVTGAGGISVLIESVTECDVVDSYVLMLGGILK